MKRAALLTLMLAGGLVPVRAAPQVAESDAEFTASGDFDGNGRTDTVIIDKAAGTMRIGYQTALETWTWAPARPAGAVPVSAAAAGRFLDTTRDAIAVASQSANRILIHPANSTTVTGVPQPIFDLIGPDVIAPVPLPGSGGTAGFDQIMAGSSIDPNSTPGARAGLDPAAGMLFFQNADAVLRQGQPVRLKSTEPWHAAFLLDPAGDTELRVYDGTVLAAPAMLASGGLPAATRYASAFFNTASPLAQFIFWTPGTAQLRVRPVTEPAAGVFDLGAEASFTLAGGNIAQVIVLDDAAGPRLLVIFNDGTSARVHTFNGSAAPVVLTTLTPAAGERFRAASLAGGGGFILSSAPAANRRSQTFRPYRRATASTYTALTSASLPSITTNSGRANVLLFSEPPFISEDAQPLAALRAGDWTRSISYGGGNVSAVAETFISTTAGLDNPLTVNLGAAPAGADEVLPNQFESYLSISSLRPVYDTPDIEPSVAPMPDNYDTAQQLVFSAPAGVTVYYRLGVDPWQAWAGVPVWLTTDTVVHYYGVDAALRSSSLRTASYTFTKDGEYLDSDHDGVPDFAELAYGLDPRSGPDTDGDTWTDDTEMLAGTDPLNPLDPVRPIFPDILELPPRPSNAGVNLTATLRSWRGLAPDLTLLPVDGTQIDALDTAGAILASRAVAAGADSVVMENLAVPAGTRLISLTTPAAWRRDDGAGPYHASQSIALVPSPPPPAPLVIEYTPVGGGPAAEAAAWLAALTAAEAAQTPRDIAATLSPVDSLVAVLVESKVDEILISRGANPAQRFSLFDTGLTDAGARRVTPTQMASLELPGSGDQPAWKLAQVHAVIDTAVKDEPGSDEIQALRLLAADIFEQFDTVWQPPSEADPDGNTAAFPQPVDLLRTIVRGDALPPGYPAVSLLSGPQIADAQAAITTVLGLPQPRPQVMLSLTARADSFSGQCSVFNNGGGTVALVDADGSPWRFKGSIAPPTGAVLQVRGFTDAPSDGCAATTVEVISAQLQTLPGGGTADTDGDGMSDEWEMLFFGSLAQTAAGDYDTDGRTNAQEFAAGTDPAGRPPAGGFSPALVPLVIPLPSITLNPDGRVELIWECSEECRRTFVYTLERDPKLDGSWEQRSASPEFLPDGRMRFTIAPDVPGRCFYRIRVTNP